MAKDSFIQIARVSEKMTEETEKEILRAYKTAQKDIKKQLSDLYTKYEKDGVLTYSEMAKYNRLDGMLKDINSTVNNTSINSGNKIKKLSGNVFENSYYQAGYTIEGIADAKLSFSLLHKDAIQASVENPIAGLTLSETLQKNRKQVITSIKQSVTQGLVMGESYKKMADRMTSALNNDATKALRVARTEAHRNQNAGTLKAVDHAVGRGVKLKKEWIATLDDRTRDTHASMDGQIVDSDKNFVSPSGARGPAPGMLGSASEDINCRCALGTILPGADETTNRQTYEEWAESRSIPVPKEVKQVQKQMAKEINKEQKISELEKSVAELQKEEKELFRNINNEKYNLDFYTKQNEHFKDLDVLGEEKITQDLIDLKTQRKAITDKLERPGVIDDEIVRLRTYKPEGWEDTIIKLSEEKKLLPDMESLYREHAKINQKVFKYEDYLRYSQKRTAINYDVRIKELAQAESRMDLVKQQLTKDKIELVDLKYKNVDVIAEVKKGKPMPFDKADGGNPNPNYKLGGGYTINCQTCVVSYEARLRGFDVKARPNLKSNSATQRLMHNTNNAFYNPKTGDYVEYIFDNSANTPLKFYKYLDDTLKSDSRYTIQFTWKGSKYSGHILTINKDTNGIISMYDPQVNRTTVGKESLIEYFKRIKYAKRADATITDYPMNCPKLMRVDNTYLNTDLLNEALEAFTK